MKGKEGGQDGTDMKIPSQQGVDAKEERVTLLVWKNEKKRMGGAKSNTKKRKAKGTLI